MVVQEISHLSGDIKMSKIITIILLAVSFQALQLSRS